MGKYILGSIVVLVLLLVLAYAILRPRITGWAEREIRAAVKRECASCEFDLEGMGLSWDGISARGVRLAGGKKGGEWVDFKVERVVLALELTSLFGDSPRLKGVTLDHPDVTFYDGDGSSAHGHGSLDSDKVIVDEIFIYGGKFTYIRDHKGTHAVLVVDAISGDIDPDPEQATARLHARIGSKGGFDVKVVSPYNKRPIVIDTELTVENQSLPALSEFFKPNAGVELEGTLTRGHARTHLKGDHLTASVYAEYQGFNMEVDKMYDRNAVQTFFTNLGAAIVTRSQNKSAPLAEKEATVELTREDGESLVSFILRGLKEASLKIAI